MSATALTVHIAQRDFLTFCSAASTSGLKDVETFVEQLLQAQAITYRDAMKVCPPLTEQAWTSSDHAINGNRDVDFRRALTPRQAQQLRNLSEHVPLVALARRFGISISAVRGYLEE